MGETKEGAVRRSIFPNFNINEHELRVLCNRLLFTILDNEMRSDIIRYTA